MLHPGGEITFDECNYLGEKNGSFFYAQKAFFDSKKEKELAKTFLELWVKFTKKHLDLIDLTCVNTEWKEYSEKFSFQHEIGIVLEFKLKGDANG